MSVSNPAPSVLPSGLGPIRIEIGGPASATFKSIDEVVWDNIPAFAVLTGLNGSGKTHLLELLAYRLTGTWHPELNDISGVNVAVTGASFGPDEVAYLPSRWDLSGAPSATIAQMQEAKQQLFEQLRHEQNIRTDMIRRSKRARLERLFGVSLNEIDRETFVKQLPDNFAFMLDDADVALGLGHVFVAYRLQLAQEHERGTAVEDIYSKIGPAPWDVVNEIFQTADFRYRVVSPLDSPFLDVYQLLLQDPQTGQKLRPMDLSSGEKTLLGLVLWLYNSQHHGRFPRLWLLDEPDAYLHPSMTRQLLDVLKEVLVERYHVRIIMITHSPSTVALAPEGSVFEMSRTKPRITPSPSRAHTIGLLTAGLVIVSPGTRYVLVEDEDDVAFYEAIRSVLSDYGPSRDPRALQPSPSLVFLPASLGTGKAKVGGGNTVVSKWVDKFDQEPLNEIFRGIIDRDSGNVPTKRIQVLGRHSIENYLLDPFVVFAVLLDQGTAPEIAGVTISQGDEHRIRAMSETELQLIVVAIRSLVEPTIPGLTTGEQGLQKVAFTNGTVVNYPGWMINRRGHDLLPIYQSALGGSSVISPPRLHRSMKRLRLIPNELVDIMEMLQR